MTEQFKEFINCDDCGCNAELKGEHITPDALYGDIPFAVYQCTNYCCGNYITIYGKKS